MMAQKGGGGGACGETTLAGGGMKKRHLEIPKTSSQHYKEEGTGGEGEVEVLKMVKATTPKGLREVKNVLRWYVPALSYHHIFFLE